MTSKTVLNMTITAATTAAVSAAIVIGCTSDTNSTASGRNYQSAGSRWEMNFTDTTFTVRKFPSFSSTTADMTVTGSVAQNSTNQFKQLTIQSTEGSAPAVGTVVNALEMVNAAAFIQPPEGAIPLAATVTGQCPSGDFNANWIVTKPNLDGGTFEQNNFNSDGAGTASYNSTSDVFSVRSSGIVNGQLEAAPGTQFTSFGMSNCQAGKLAVTNSGEVFDMYFTSTGQIVVKFPDAMGAQIISGLPATSAPVAAASIDGTYSVLMYRSAASADLSDATLEPAKVTFSGGNGTLRLITDVGANTEAGSDLYTFGTFSNQDGSAAALNNGLFRLVISGSATGQLICATSDSTPRPIACYGFTGTHPNRRPITLLGHIR